MLSLYVQLKFKGVSSQLCLVEHGFYCAIKCVLTQLFIGFNRKLVSGINLTLNIHTAIRSYFVIDCYLHTFIIADLFKLQNS